MAPATFSMILTLPGAISGVFLERGGMAPPFRGHSQPRLVRARQVRIGEAHPAKPRLHQWNSTEAGRGDLLAQGELLGNPLRGQRVADRARRDQAIMPAVQLDQVFVAADLGLRLGTR